MINVSKQLFITLCIIVILVVLTLCVSAIVKNDTEQLVQNVVLAVTSIVGLFLRYNDDEDRTDDDDHRSE